MGAAIFFFFIFVLLWLFVACVMPGGRACNPMASRKSRECDERVLCRCCRCCGENVTWILRYIGLSKAIPQFRMAFKESTSTFSPNGFSSLQRLVKDESRGLGLRPALALLRLSHHDPDVFYKFKQVKSFPLFTCHCENPTPRGKMVSPENNACCGCWC